ncbi:hypothetical protein [Sediminispirochaeta bajacaliforniensis]|nr:hypothetical protein [Sediminispirochaeta bajacaliforniensis]
MHDDRAIAHEGQTLRDHLKSVGALSRRNAAKIGYYVKLKRSAYE